MNIDQYIETELAGIYEDYHDYNFSELSSLESSKIYPMVLSLSLYKCNLTSLKGIENFPNIESLDISQNDLSIWGLEGIENCKKLNTIYCKSCKLDSLLGVELLPNLKMISFGENRLPMEVKEIKEKHRKCTEEVKKYYNTVSRKRKIENILKRNKI